MCKLKVKPVILSFFFWGTFFRLQGQVASFTAPDTVCVNTPVAITNTSVGASSFFWNFCTADANTIPTQIPLGNPGNRLSLPAYMDYVQYNGNYYGFVVNNSPGGLIRLDFGNSLLNTPASVDLGNFGGIISNSAQGIQIVQNNGNWYAIIVSGDPGTFPPTASRILKVEFGANLANPTPVATNWGNVGNMNYPHDIYIFQDESANWHGLTVSYRNSTVTKFSFGTGFDNPPTGVNLGNIGTLNGPTGICPINDNGVWRVFVTNFNSHTLSRIDFGSSLTNTPTNAVNLGNPGGFSNPRDLYIFRYCGESVGYVVNNNAAFTRLNFSTLTTAPIATALGSINGATNIHSISKVFRVQEDMFAFLPSSTSNNLTTIRFVGCTNSNVPSSSQQTPPAVTYNTPGIYNINLTINDGLPTQSAFCKQVVVRTAPVITKSADATICRGDSAQLAVSGGTSYQWIPSAGLSADNVPNPKASPIVTNKYYVDVNNQGCIARDSITVSVTQSPLLSLSPGNVSVCPGDTVRLLASGGDTYEWLLSSSNNPTTNGIIITPVTTAQYPVKITSNTCSIVDTMYANVTVRPVPAVTVAKSGDIDCNTSEVQLSASGGVQYQWSPSAGLSSSTIPDPMARVTQTTTFTATATGANGCVASDSVTVHVLGPGSGTNGYFVSNAFTPNGDGKNDCFGVSQWGAVTSLQLSIFNRWGNRVFHTTNTSSCWNGTYKGAAQPAGTYIYLIKATTNCGEVERKGTIVLIR